MTAPNELDVPHDAVIELSEPTPEQREQWRVDRLNWEAKRRRHDDGAEAGLWRYFTQREAAEYHALTTELEIPEQYAYHGDPSAARWRLLVLISYGIRDPELVERIARRATPRVDEGQHKWDDGRGAETLIEHDIRRVLWAT